MFQPETEDMLPRMAPKPSPDVPIGASDGIMRPQVPEVSILFGQQDGSVQHQTLNITSQQENKSFPPQTYAAWKKQMLPKFNYATSANMADKQLQESNIMTHDYNSPRTNLYPMRSTTTAPSNVDLSGYVGSSGGVAHQMAYRRSLEGCSNNVYQQTQHLPALLSQVPLRQLSSANSRDILTICAGTQTDTIVDSSNYVQHLQSENLASRKDVENIQKILDEVRIEQQRLLKIVETFMFNYHSQLTVKPQIRDIGVQVDCVESVELPGDVQSMQDIEPVPKNKFLHHLNPAKNILQTPRGKPMAQSTTYRPSSPQFQLLQHDLPEVVPDSSNQQVSSKSKSASDTSLAMNELALKYLPKEKLSELLKELNMDCALAIANSNVPSSPAGVNIDKFEKGSSDISNDSYKYLKKYRLLPEDHEENRNNNISNPNFGVIENCNQNQLQYNSPQYSNVRITAIDQRQTPTNKCLPYTGRLPLSPLVRASPPPLLQPAVTQNTVNLENIKHQPKFL